MSLFIFVSLKASVSKLKVLVDRYINKGVVQRKMLTDFNIEHI